MSTPAGWYDDPTRGGRLRYWDGSQWTEWVSENGQTASEPLGAPQQPASGTPSQVMEVPAEISTASERAAEPTPGIQPAPAAAGGTWGTATPAAVVATGPAGGYPFNLLGRVGHGIAALGGLITLGAIGQTLVEQQPLGNGYEAAAAVPVTGLVLTAGAVVAALVPNIWARLGGHLVAAGATLFLLLFMIGTRTGDQLFAGTDIDLKFGWWCIAIAALLGVVGTLMATFFFTTPARGDDGRGSAPPLGVIGFIMSLVGILVVPLSAAGGAAGLLGKHDSDASSRRIGGRGLAVAAFWIGLVAFALWGIGMWIGGMVATP